MLATIILPVITLIFAGHGIDNSVLNTPGVATPDVPAPLAPETTLNTEAETSPEQITIPLLYTNLQYKKLDNQKDIELCIDEITVAITCLNTACASDDYFCDAVVQMQNELKRLSELQQKLQQDIIDLQQADIPETKPAETTKPTKPAKKPSSDKPVNKPSNNSTSNNTATKDEATKEDTKYYYATQTWKYLRNMGYSNAVCAGIMGNFMTETGGHTLNIDPYDYSSNGRYYGIAQWSSKYYPEVHGKDLDYQLEFLPKTIKKEFDNYGHLYKKGFTYEDFLNLDSPRDAALAFAKVYERCGSGSYSKRQNGAEKAYDYFVS